MNNLTVKIKNLQLDASPSMAAAARPFPPPPASAPKITQLSALGASAELEALLRSSRLGALVSPVTGRPLSRAFFPNVALGALIAQHFADGSRGKALPGFLRLPSPVVLQVLQGLAGRELARASQYQRRAKTRICIIIACVLAVIVILVVVLKYGLKKI